MQKWYDENVDAILRELFSFLRFKTISAHSECFNELFSCATWLKDYFSKIGLNSKLLPTKNYPLVFAENKNYMKDRPTILIYGHYDVQPIDPIRLWNHDPFDPKIVNDQIYARGALDNKGQIFYAISAAHYFLEKEKTLPFNLKFCVEGEEETSSTGFFGAIDSYKEELKADYLLAVDFGMFDETTPSITLGARGIVCMTLEFVGSKTDLHSGEFGGLAYNPLKACVQTLSKIWDEKGKIVIPHFYDEVEENQTKVDFFIDKKQFEKDFGIKAFSSEEGFSLVESNWFRPTVEINGIGGGYFEEGFKTVIPGKVICKLSSRLVKNQKPEKIAKLIKEFLQKHTKKGIEINVTLNEGGSAIRGNKEGKLTKVLSSAMEEVFNKSCQYIFCGGSVAIISLLIEKLKVEPTMIGLGLKSDNIHAPNEHFSLERFKKGFLCIAKTLELFGRR